MKQILNCTDGSVWLIWTQCCSKFNSKHALNPPKAQFLCETTLKIYTLSFYYMMTLQESDIICGKSKEWLLNVKLKPLLVRAALNPFPSASFQQLISYIQKDL